MQHLLRLAIQAQLIQIGQTLQRIGPEHSVLPLFKGWYPLAQKMHRDRSGLLRIVSPHQVFLANKVENRTLKSKTAV